MHLCPACVHFILECEVWSGQVSDIVQRYYFFVFSSAYVITVYLNSSTYMSPFHFFVFFLHILSLICVDIFTYVIILLCGFCFILHSSFFIHFILHHSSSSVLSPVRKTNALFPEDESRLCNA